MPDETASWSGAVLVLPGGQVLLRSDAAGLVAGVISAYARAEGVPLSPAAEHVRAACLAAVRRAETESSSGPADVRSSPPASSSGSWITTAQVALRLGIGERQARRLVVSGVLGEKRKSKGNWMVRAEEVAAYAAGRGENDGRAG
jgi:hypothetical protein